MPPLLGGLLRYFRKDPVETYETAMWYGAGLCVASVLNMLCFNHLIYRAYHVGLKIRVAVCSLVYRKVGEARFRFGAIVYC